MENISLKNLFRRHSLITYAWIFGPPILFLAFVETISIMKGVPFNIFSRDPLQTLEGKFYVGTVSQLGIVMWSATVAALFLSLRLSLLMKKPRQESLFLLFSGLLSLMMLIDDLFMFHDVIMPTYFLISEKFFYGFYALAVVGLFLYFRKIVLKTDYILFVLAVVSLGGSVLSDIVTDLGVKLPDPFFIEDGFKFIGITGWVAYFTRSAFSLIRPAE